MKKNSLFTAICTAALCITLLIRSAELSGGIRRGLSLCSQYIIPAVFPFMALSLFIFRSRAGDFLSTLLKPVTRFFHLPDFCGSILLSALIGGYPSAAKCINIAVCEKRLSPKTAEKMLCFCVNAGPPFIISALGYGIFGNIKTGVLIFAAVLISSMLMGFFLLRRENPMSCDIAAGENSVSTAKALVEAVTSAAESCFILCAFVIIFCGVSDVFRSIIQVSGKSSAINAVFSGFFEVTAGCSFCGEIGGGIGIILAGAITAFSGISVILQIAAVTEESGISLVPFIVSRFIHAGLTAGILRIMLCFSTEAVEVFSVKGGNYEAFLSTSAPATVSLICMASLFLLSLIPSRGEKEPLFTRLKEKFTLKTSRNSL